MKTESRRQFLQKASQTGMTIAVGAVARRFGIAQNTTTTKVVIDTDRQIAPMSHELFGSFLEQLGRAIYEGIYEPGSKFADRNGFRTDVMKEVRELGVPIVRWPGGNFVSGYHWLDGVGPKDKRPAMLDHAWDTLETNQFGTDEFIDMGAFGGNGAAARAELRHGVRGGCGGAGGVLQCSRGHEVERIYGVRTVTQQPHNVKFWCVGNEMDGPWQIGHMPAREYGIKATDAARQMRVSGSNDQADRVRIERAVHADLYRLGPDGAGGVLRRGGRHFASPLLGKHRRDQSRQPELLGDEPGNGPADPTRLRRCATRCARRSGRASSCFFRSTSGTCGIARADGDFADGHGKPAPHLLEEPYNLEDALLVGGLANSLIRHSDRVKVACLAQLVNVIAPIATNEDGILRHTIYYPYAWALKYARGRALSLDPEGPGYEVTTLGRPIESIGLPEPGFGEVPWVDMAATLDTENKTAALFLFNRNRKAAGCGNVLARPDTERSECVDDDDWAGPEGGQYVCRSEARSSADARKPEGWVAHDDCSCPLARIRCCHWPCEKP